MFGVQLLAGGPEDGLSPGVARSRTGDGFLQVTSGHLVREKGAAGHAGLQVAPELGGVRVAEDVVVVVDGGAA